MLKGQGRMHIITTIYFAEFTNSAESELKDRRRDATDLADLEDKDRLWVSLYEGKNRVENIDEDR
jgi:hypothetical protein